MPVCIRITSDCADEQVHSKRSKSWKKKKIFVTRIIALLVLHICVFSLCVRRQLYTSEGEKNLASIVNSANIVNSENIESNKIKGQLRPLMTITTIG